MKDENNDAIMTKFIELRANMYVLLVNGKKDTKKIKGIKNNIVAKSIFFDNYTRSDYMCLFDETEKNDAKTIMYKIKIIQSVHHIRNKNRSKSLRL